MCLESLFHKKNIFKTRLDTSFIFLLSATTSTVNSQIPWSALFLDFHR